MARTKFTNRVSVQTATGQVALSPNQVANLRGQIARNMETHIALADDVIKGHTEWSPTQARVFSNLLNKVIPDLSASYHQHEHSHRALNEMSREELERIASGVDEIIDAEPMEETDDGQEQGPSEQPDSGSSANENIDGGAGQRDESTGPQFSTGT
jgi:uncharacterized protein YjiS (DUF1127 family)